MPIWETPELVEVAFSRDAQQGGNGRQERRPGEGGSHKLGIFPS